MEKKLLSSDVSLPLNVHGNASQEAAAVLSAARLKARRLGDGLEIVADNGGPASAAALVGPYWDFTDCPGHSLRSGR